MKIKWRKVKLLSDVSDDVVRAFDRCGWKRFLDAGEPIIWKGDVCEAVYFVASGAVEVYRNAVDGREHTLGIMVPGDSFNLVPVFVTNGENPANVRCINKTGLLIVKKSDFKLILTRFPEFSSKVLTEMASRLATMTKKAGELALHSVRQRLASFLITEGDKAKAGQNLFWTRDDMARQIGTVRDVVGRNLKAFEEKELIKRDKGNILLLERWELEKIANGEDTT